MKEEAKNGGISGGGLRVLMELSPRALAATNGARVSTESGGGR